MRAQFRGVPIGPADEEGDGLDAGVLPFAEPIGEGPAGGDLAAFIEGDAETTAAPLEERGALGLAGGVLQPMEFQRREGPLSRVAYSSTPALA